MTNKEAIDYIKLIFVRDRANALHFISHGEEQALDLAIKALEEQERPTGEWEDYSVTFYKCPECGYLLEKDCPRCQNKVILPRGGRE